MTALLTREPGSRAPSDPGRTQGLTGTRALVRFLLRRDRVRLSVWVLSVGLLTVYSVVALTGVYPDAASRQERASLMESPAAIMLGGPGFGVEEYTIGAMVANELGLTVMLIAAIMSVLLVVRHTRVEEEAGRTELVRSAIVGRHAQLSAALVVMVLADLAIGAVVAVGLAATGLDLVGSVAFALSISLVGVLFGAVAAVTAQVAEHSRSASGSALAVLAAAALVRGVGDVLDPGGSWLSWFSPIAWAQQTRVFVDLRWWPLVPLALAAVALAALAYRLAGGRDLGGGLVPPRPGPASASRWLSGPVGLALRQQRGSLLGWGAGLVLTGATFGSLSDSVVEAMSDNPVLADVIALDGGQDLVDAFFGVLMVYIALGAAAFGVGSVLRLRSEEGSGRVEVLLAGALSRPRLLLSAVAVAVVGAGALLAAGGAAMGAAAGAVTGQAGLVGTLAGAALVQLPAVLVLVGVAVALLGLAPRWSGLTWVPLGYAVVVGMFGALLRLPERALRLSPFDWVPALPGEDLHVVPLLVLTAIAAVLVAAGVVGFRRRDVPS